MTRKLTGSFIFSYRQVESNLEVTVSKTAIIFNSFFPVRTFSDALLRLVYSVGINPDRLAMV